MGAEEACLKILLFICMAAVKLSFSDIPALIQGNQFCDFKMFLPDTGQFEDFAVFILLSY